MGGPSFLREVDQLTPQDTTEGYSRYKTKVKVKNNLIQPSPNQNLLEPSLSPFWLMSYLHRIPKGNVKWKYGKVE